MCRTSDSGLVDAVVVAKTSDNLVLDAEDELELVVAALLEDNGGLFELSQSLGLIKSLEDDVAGRTVLEDDVHLDDDDTTGVVLGCMRVRQEWPIVGGRRVECHFRREKQMVSDLERIL